MNVILLIFLSLLPGFFFGNTALHASFSCQELSEESYLYNSVNVITGDYSEADTDASHPAGRLKVRRCFSNTEGWYFNLPLKKKLLQPDTGAFAFI
ncbi:MAG: hypothetical protein WCG42_09820, partial [Parachlamydiaceae bacterium]